MTETGQLARFRSSVCFGFSEPELAAASQGRQRADCEESDRRGLRNDLRDNLVQLQVQSWNVGAVDRKDDASDAGEVSARSTADAHGGEGDRGADAWSAEGCGTGDERTDRKVGSAGV